MKLPGRQIYPDLFSKKSKYAIFAKVGSKLIVPCQVFFGFNNPIDRIKNQITKVLGINTLIFYIPEDVIK